MESYMETSAIWQEFSPRDHYGTLSQNIAVDIAIIGGGITGITAALNLLNQGKKVALIEAKTIGGHTTSHSTGNLYIAVQPYYQNIAEKFNLDIAKQIAHSRNLAIDFIE